MTQQQYLVLSQVRLAKKAVFNLNMTLKFNSVNQLLLKMLKKHQLAVKASSL